MLADILNRAGRPAEARDALARGREIETRGPAARAPESLPAAGSRARRSSGSKPDVV